MTDNRAARRRLRALDRRTQRQITEMAPTLTNQKILVDIRTVIEGMRDPRMGAGVVEMLCLAWGTAQGAIDGTRQCFVCCRPWVMERPPVGVASMELLGS